MNSQDERRQYSKYVLYGCFSAVICTEKEFQKIRDDLKNGCKFQRQVPTSHYQYRKFVMGKVDFWYYEDNGTYYYLVTNDTRRKIIQFLDSYY